MRDHTVVDLVPRNETLRTGLYFCISKLNVELLSQQSCGTDLDRVWSVSRAFPSVEETSVTVGYIDLSLWPSTLRPPEGSEGAPTRRAKVILSLETAANDVSCTARG